MQHICFVKNLTGKTFAFEIQSTDYVGKLLRQIQDREGMRPANYHLYYGGTRLMADRTLKDYNIQTEPTSARTLNIALRGGYGMSDFSLEQESWDRYISIEGALALALAQTAAATSSGGGGRPDHYEMQIETNKRLESQVENKKSKIENQVEVNRANISRNRAELFLAECEVMQNKTKAYLARSLVLENQALVAKNYTSAFLGNRQLANQNTDDVFRNRYAIYRHIPIDASDPVQVNFREALGNRAKIEFIEHRSSLNSKMLNTTLKIAHLNAQLIAINSEIMETNRGIVEFNSASIAKNTEILKSGISASGATPESNAAFIAENSRRIVAIRQRADQNNDLVTAVKLEAESNRVKILANNELIYERRAVIVANAANIEANQQAVAQFIGNF